MTRVRLEVDLDELAATIAESVKRALFAQGFTVARVVSGAIHPRTADGPCPCNACANHGELLRGLSRGELERAFSELGRNTAGGLMLFADDGSDDDSPECGTVIGNDDGSTSRCSRRAGHGGGCCA